MRRFVQPRTYDDTFAGHEYRLNMEEHPGAVGPVRKVDCRLRKQPRQTRQTEAQIRLWKILDE